MSHLGSVSTENFSTENLDYLQRTGAKFVPPPLAGAKNQSTSDRNVVQVIGVGRLAKSTAADTRQTALSDWQLTQLISEDLLIGLYGSGSPIAFLVSGEPGSVSISFGLCESSSGEHIPSDQHDILSAVLNGVYPGIELRGPVVLGKVVKQTTPIAGLVLGIPTAKPPDATDGAFAIDRLIRSMAGATWQALILAEPILESAIRIIRGQLMAEMRAMQSSASAAGSPSPLAEQYHRLLSISLDELTNAQAVGAWRTAVYLLGTPESFYRLSGAWRSVFSGSSSLPEPIRVWPFPDALGLADSWLMPDTSEVKGPGPYTHPYKYQTVLSSSQLAAYIHLPQLETRGFTVKLIPEFDVVPPPITSESAICIGTVVERTQSTDRPYSVAAKSLAGHVFVSGMTGTGKTNTVHHLLREAFTQKIGCLVIEPAKREYRMLLGDSILGPTLRVFTAGDESTAPLRLNPFEVLPGAKLSEHMDLLRSVFSSSFGMWVPLPQVLEKCLVSIYQDRGWELTRNSNHRLDDKDEWDSSAFPTLSDLVSKVEEVVPTLGFDPEASSRILASLTARLNGLRSGGKGRMLDVQESLSMDELLGYPTVLELESMGDDDDKAFIIGLLLIRLVEYRRLHGEKKMQHFLVIEEAHRLLANVSRSADQEQSDPRGKAVETFTNLLSEIRAYGQGIIIADQVPTRLAPDVIKNTNLKISHRVVAGDDRAVLGQAMAMSDRQIAALSSLKRGQAVVFSGETDDAPILVEIQKFEHVRGALAERIRSGDEIRDRMEKAWQGNKHLLRQTAACEKNCPAKEAEAECRAAASILEKDSCRAAIARLILSIIENGSTIDRLWEDVKVAVQAARSPTTDQQRVLRCIAIRAAAWYSSRRSAQAGWSYAKSRAFETALRAVLLSLVGEGDTEKSLWDFQRLALELHERTYPPYPACDAICAQHQPPVCLYRFAAADLLSTDAVKAKTTLALTFEEGPEFIAIWNEACTAGWRLAALANESKEEESTSTTSTLTRASLCLAQQAIMAQPRLHPRIIDSLMKALIEKSTEPPPVPEENVAVENGIEGR
jgi:hypothetical protein